MPQGDGDGWVSCRCGARHWGHHGAAGLLVVRRAVDQVTVLLQHRSAQVHDGGTWALPGGARDSHEDVVTTALREATEEVGADGGHLDVVACVRGVDHGDWAYTYVVALAHPGLTVCAANFETQALTWVPVTPPIDHHLPLHPSLDADWPTLTAVARAVG